MKKIIIGIIAAAAAWTAWAASSAFTYQGVLLDETGAAMAGNKAVEFRIYANQTGGSPLWGRMYSVLLDESGLFSAELSDAGGSRLPDSPDATLSRVFAANAGTALYLGLTVSGTSGEISPRQKLLPVPYATFAADVAGTSGDFSVSGLITASSATISNNVSAASLDVSGSIAVSGDISVSGAISGFGAVPVGGIIMWSGSVGEIPDGWSLCNGSNGTPDLQGRFVVGAGSAYSVGATGGEEKHTLTIEEMPRHSHSYSYRAYDLAGSWKDQSNFYAVDKGSNWKSASTDSVGGGAAHENRPPYYALCFIMRIR